MYSYVRFTSDILENETCKHWWWEAIESRAQPPTFVSPQGFAPSCDIQGFTAPLPSLRGSRTHPHTAPQIAMIPSATQEYPAVTHPKQPLQPRQTIMELVQEETASLRICIPQVLSTAATVFAFSLYITFISEPFKANQARRYQN